MPLNISYFLKSGNFSFITIMVVGDKRVISNILETIDRRFSFDGYYGQLSEDGTLLSINFLIESRTCDVNQVFSLINQSDVMPCIVYVTRTNIHDSTVYFKSDSHYLRGPFFKNGTELAIPMSKIADFDELLVNYPELSKEMARTISFFNAEFSSRSLHIRKIEKGIYDDRPKYNYRDHNKKMWI